MAQTRDRPRERPRHGGRDGHEHARGRTAVARSHRSRQAADALVPQAAAGGPATARRRAAIAPYREARARRPKERRDRSHREEWAAPGTETATDDHRDQRDIVREAGVYRPRPRGSPSRDCDEDLVGPSKSMGFGAIDLSPRVTRSRSVEQDGIRDLQRATRRRPVSADQRGRNERSPRWSPVDKLAFLRDKGATSAGRSVVDRAGERERNITGEPSVSHRDISWSPDGQRIAYVSNVGGKGFGVSIIDVKSGVRVPLTDGSHEDLLPRWSPDGRKIIFASRRESTRTNVGTYLVSAGGGPATMLDTREGKDGESQHASFSPDGGRISFTTNVRGRYEPAIAKLDQTGDGIGEIEYLTQNIHDETEPTWRPDGRGLLYLHSEESETSVRRAFAVSHATHAVADRHGVHASAHVGPDSDLVAFLWTGARDPWDVYVTGERMVAPKRLTRSLPATIDPATLVEPMHVRYPGADGRDIPRSFMSLTPSDRGGACPTLSCTSRRPTGIPALVGSARVVPNNGTCAGAELPARTVTGANSRGEPLRLGAARISRTRAGRMAASKASLKRKRVGAYGRKLR